MISQQLLQEFGAATITFKKGDYIIKEGEIPRNYFQIISGQVKMFTCNEEGKEFVHGIFSAAHSFGEPPLFVERSYPANAIAISDVVMFCLSKVNLLKLLHQQPEVAVEIINVLSQRLHYKSVMAVEIAFEKPEHRILKLLKYTITHYDVCIEKEGYRIDLTRQQIADLTGLRVETVIKAIKKLEKSKAIQLINRKIFVAI